MFVANEKLKLIENFYGEANVHVSQKAATTLRKTQTTQKITEHQRIRIRSLADAGDDVDVAATVSVAADALV